MAYVKWKPILASAADIVDSFDTGVTLRQLFYRLVATLVLPNTRGYYSRLSSYTAEGRRDGSFPDLLDRTSRIERFITFDGVADARDYIRDLYRRDRTEGQPWTILLGVEKAGISAQLDQWFTDPLGIPHVALGGYASQTLVGDVRKLIAADDRTAVFVYAGDHDPTGVDIQRDFVERVGLFDKVEHVALTPAQIKHYRLPLSIDNEVAAKLARDTRAAAFKKRFGDLVQYEVDALAPDVLRDLYRNAIDGYHNPVALKKVLRIEKRERGQL